MITSDLQKKIDFAVKLLRSIPQDGDIEVGYSGGKDSDVILQLVKESEIPYRAIYRNTSIDPPFTIAHAKENGAEIRQPKEKFFDLVKRKGPPTMRARFCCEVLKEYKICDRVVLGIRRSESSKRKERYQEPEICRVYSKKEKVRQYLPILNWTDADVEMFIADRGIKCHPLYYDEQGNFHVERRLGNAYNVVFHNLFTTSYADYKSLIRGGIFGEEVAIDAKSFMEEHFNIDLTI